MELSLKDLISVGCKNARDIVTHILRLRGVLPFPDSGINSYGYKIEKAAIPEALELLKEYRDAYKPFDSERRKELDKKYFPEIDEEYLSRLLSISVIGRTRFRCDGKEWVYDIRKGGVGRVCPYRSKEKQGDKTLYWISKMVHKKIYDVLTDYYKWKHNYRTTEQIAAEYFVESFKRYNVELINDDEELKRKVIGKTAVTEVVKYTANDVDYEFNPFEDNGMSPIKNVEKTGVTVDPLEWRPEKLDTGKGWYINECFVKLKDGTYAGDRTGPVPFKTDEGGWTVMWSELDKPTLLRIAKGKDWLLERGMDKAVNRPKKGWRFNHRECCFEFKGIYTLSGSRSKDTLRGEGAKPVEVAQLNRYMSPRYINGKPIFKKFVAGSQSIPYLLENVKPKDKFLFICEGVPDACFVRNGVAINDWKPSGLSEAIIKTMQEKRKMRVIYITDNWRVGDEGGLDMLEWAQANAPDLEMVDWKLLGNTKAKDLGEYVKERVDAGNKDFITEDGDYQMPRELILLATRKACEIHAKDMCSFDEIIPA